LRKKILLWGFIILLIFTLSGCGTIPDDTPDQDNWIDPDQFNWVELTEEDILEELINHYWYAISQGWYRLAKHHCILDGDAYNVVEEYEMILYPLTSTLEFVIYYNEIEIMENDAIVNIDLTIINTSGYGNSILVEEEILYSYIIRLVKPKTWKLK